MASLNLVTKDNRSHILKHPALSFIGVSLCLGAIAVAVRFILSYQPVIDNANEIVLQQSRQLESREQKQHIYKQRRQALATRDAFWDRQQSVSDEINAFAALLKQIHIKFSDVSIRLNSSRLEVTALYEEIPQTEKLKTWLNTDWKSQSIAEPFHQQLQPEKRVLFVLERSSS